MSILREMKTGRNDRCPCNSGRKYKHCCAQAVRWIVDPPPSVASTSLSRLVDLAAAHRYPELEDLAAEISRTQPQSGLAWKALGVAQMMQGKDALPALERAAQLLPQDAECHSNRGAALRRIGRLEEALACYAHALDMLPNSAEVWNNLGNVLRDLGRHAEALDAFGRALGLKPDFAKAHNNVGNAVQDLGKAEDAMASYRRALDLDPLYAEAHYNLGSVLRLQMRAGDAESCCRRALELDPKYPAAIVMLAELHSDRGQFADADALYRRAIAIEPDAPEAWAGLAGLRRMSQDDADWLREAQRIVSLPLAPRRELILRYALGKYFDDVADYEQAFANYRRANELTKVGRPAHDRRRVTEGVDRLIRAHDQEWVCRPRPQANRSERPVFIVGMPRSGTTLAEQILAAQGAVFGAGELPFWNTAASRYAAARAAGAHEESAALAALAEDYLGLLDGLCAEASRVVDKMPGNFLYLGLLHAALPKARIIHLRRNPIDTCLSIYFQNFSAVHSYANDLEDLAHYYAEYLRIMEHWRRILPPGVMLEIRYEELVDDPETSSRRLLEFIGLPWDAGCLEYHRSTRPISTFSKWQARQKIHTTSVARWRHYEPFIDPLRPLATNQPRDPDAAATRMCSGSKPAWCRSWIVL
jgi:tetratricopeptide (TPR) repeat protein